MAKRRSFSDLLAESPAARVQQEVPVLNKDELLSHPQEAELLYVPRQSIHRDFKQRYHYDMEQIKAWALSEVKKDGEDKRTWIRSPLWVRPHPTITGEWQLAAGNRRYLSAEVLDIPELLIRVFQFTDKQMREAYLVENTQREDFNPLEEADGILDVLSDELNLPAPEVIRLFYRMQNEKKGRATSNVLGSFEGELLIATINRLSRVSWESFIATRLSLLTKPPEILEAIRDGKIQYTKALAIAKLKDPEARNELLEEAITQALSLTQIQERVAELSTAGTDVELSKPRPLKQRFSATVKRLSVTKVWANPDKAKQLERLLKQLDKLVEDEVAENQE